MRKSATRLASSHVRVWANTWTRRVEVDLGKDGRLSVVVVDGGRKVVDVELPCVQGEHVDAFTPTVMAVAGVEYKVLGEVK